MVDRSTTCGVDVMRRGGSVLLSLIRSTSNSAADRAIRSKSWPMVVSWNTSHDAIGISSKPIRLSTSGTRTPVATAALSAPIATASLPQKTAVGGEGSASNSRIARCPVSNSNDPRWVSSGASPIPASARARRKPISRSRPALVICGPKMPAIRRCPSPMRCFAASRPPRSLSTTAASPTPGPLSRLRKTNGTRRRDNSAGKAEPTSVVNRTTPSTEPSTSCPTGT